VALRLRGGLVRPVGSGIEGESLSDTREPVSHPLKRQFAGGAYTVRGFGQNLLGPKVLLANPADLPGCDGKPVTENNTWVCDPNESGLQSARAFPRPVGGENAIVANVEIRVPFASANWGWVAFLDMGRVWTIGEGVGTSEAFAWTPGVGLRYESPVGPLRVDIGYSTGGNELAPVVSETLVNGSLELVQLGTADDVPLAYDWDPYAGSGSNFFNRLQLHLSIGHAF
jgi:hypothetical protein